MVCHLSEICHLWAWQWLCKHITLFLFPTIGFMIGYTRSLKGKPEHGKNVDDKMTNTTFSMICIVVRTV